MTAVLPGDSIDDTLRWLQERKENCIRIAGQKNSADRDGWIEDAAYFGHAISLINRAYFRGNHKPVASA